MAFAEVGLYWDFENVGIGAGFSMADLAALLTRVRGYGRLHESRLYYDSCKASSEGFLSKHRELVERLGVTLVDCPTSDKKEAIDKLALSIFSKIAERGGGPTDPATRKQPPCHQCGAVVKDYDGRCGSCGTQFPACIFSGRSILDMTEAASCKSCKRRYLVHEVGTKQNCALCHHPLPNATKASKPVGNLS
jgi:hypothetical protein